MRISLTDTGLIDRKSARRFTDEGFLVVPGIVARTGIYDYRACEIGGDKTDTSIVKAYRSPEEVFAADSIASLEGATVVHIHKDVNARNWKRAAVGDCHGIAKVSDTELGAEKIYVRDEAAIKAVNAGDNELSCGYTAVIDRTPGVTPDGQRYDVAIRDLRYKHLAIVPKGRGGPGVKLADEDYQPMKIVMVDGLPFEFDEKVAPVVEKVLHDRDSARAELADAKAEAVKLVDAYAEKVADAKKHADPAIVSAQVAAVFTAINDARALDPKFETKLTDADGIRREALASIKDAGMVALRDAFLGGDVAKASSDALARCLAGLAVGVKNAPKARVSDSVIGAALSAGNGRIEGDFGIRDFTDADVEKGGR